MRQKGLSSVKRKGFTLVELLVVVAIIALLISILAPSLKAAKDLAKQLICMTNQRAIGTALGLYAEVNSGHMMYGYWLTDAAKAPSYPNGICLAFSGDSTAVDPTDGLISDRRAFGWAYARGFLGPASMFYCPNISPEIATRGGGQAKDYPQPWAANPRRQAPFGPTTYA
jgi:prepilin-type N-terminal cleavage/methylation domain-containing protein